METQRPQNVGVSSEVPPKLSSWSTAALCWPRCLLRSGPGAGRGRGPQANWDVSAPVSVRSQLPWRWEGGVKGCCQGLLEASSFRRQILTPCLPSKPLQPHSPRRGRVQGVGWAWAPGTTSLTLLGTRSANSPFSSLGCTPSHVPSRWIQRTPRWS